MRIGPKTRGLIEILGILGAEACEALFLLPQFHQFMALPSEDALHFRLRRLYERELIDYRRAPKEVEWIARLEEKGKDVLDGRLEPQACWNRQWDELWRVFMFDLPSQAKRERSALRKWLMDLRFGKFQGSAWISPHPLGDWSAELEAINVDPHAAVYFTADLGNATRSASHVEKTWKLDLVHANYRAYLDFLEKESPLRMKVPQLELWQSQESALWQTAIQSDPLLPQGLRENCRKGGHLGPGALAARKRAYEDWREAILVAEL